MKLAEALIERADLQTKLESLRSRLIANAKVQEGTTPNEDPKDLIKELNENTERLEYLISHINRTNCMTVLENGKSISDLIAERDVLSKKVSILGSLASNASDVTYRLTRSEIVVLPSFDVKKIQSELNKLSKNLREIDTKIQETNWLTELAE